MSFRMLTLADKPPGDMSHGCTMCDLCDTMEYSGIIGGTDGLDPAYKSELIPMYIDTRPEEWGLTVCHVCLMNGTYYASEAW